MKIKFCPVGDGAVFDGWDVVVDNKCPSCGAELTHVPIMMHPIEMDEPPQPDSIDKY